MSWLSVPARDRHRFGHHGRAAGGGNQALALLGNTLPTGAILVVLITMFGPISGAHFNPAVTAVFWLRARHRRPNSGGLCACAGGWGADRRLLGTRYVRSTALAVRHENTQRHRPVVSGGCGDFGLLLTILATLKAKPAAIPASVGLYIVAAYWFTASTSFANPAVTIARAFSDTFAGIRLIDAPAFIAAQLAGAACAFLVSRWLLVEPLAHGAASTGTQKN